MFLVFESRVSFLLETVFDVINQETERIEAKKRAKCQVEDRSMNSNVKHFNFFLKSLIV